MTFWPICVGWVCGVIMGDPLTGTVLGATLGTIFLGVTFYGGAMAVDTRMATCLTVPLAISTGMDIDTAIAIAVPIAAFGIVLEPIVRTINTTVWGPFVDRAVDKLNFRRIRLGSGLLPLLTTILVTAPPMFVMLYLGDNVVNAMISAMPEWLTTALTAMGGLLPALGFGTYIRVIGTKKTIPFFILGFFMMKFFNLPILGIAIFAFATAYLTIYVNPELMGD